MLIRNIVIFIISAFHLLEISAFTIPENQIINICAEDTGWAPYSILEKYKSNGTFKLSGFNRDLLEEVFKRSNIKFNFVIKPWQRCLKEGISGDVHIVLDAASNEQRKRDYLLSTAIYKMTPAYFYHNSKKMNKLTAEKVLEESPICGQSGYTYTNFGIPNDVVKKLSKALFRIVDLVSEKRCAIGLTRLEVLKRELTSFKEYSNISYDKIHGAKKEEFFWLINKSFNFSNYLKELIDKEYSALEKSGFLKKLRTKYKI